MTTSEPTTGEIVRALRDAPSYNGMAGTTTTVEDIAADRLESQEQTIAALTARAEKAEKIRDIWEKKWWEEALEKVEAQVFKEKAERERDAAIADMKLIADNVRETHCDETCCFACKYDFDTSKSDSGEFKSECPGFDRDDCFEWRGLPQEGEGK